MDVKNQVASANQVPSVEDGIEVGQDNLGMDSLDEETAGARENLAGTKYYNSTRTVTCRNDCSER